jgi:acetyl-CoA carboxylase biotin carboxyl carrier protein
VPDRDEAARLADHAQIEGLADELLPALIAKLGATGLGELEVREGDWKIRLRRSADGSTTGPKAPAGRSAKPAPGHVDHTHPAGAEAVHGPYRLAATSPAVGIYHSRPEITSGSRVRTGDRIGDVDVLGITQEVVAPVNGIVGAGLVESGDAVEYGQQLVWIELISTPADRAGRDA